MITGDINVVWMDFGIPFYCIFCIFSCNDHGILFRSFSFMEEIVCEGGCRSCQAYVCRRHLDILDHIRNRRYYKN